MPIINTPPISVPSLAAYFDDKNRKILRQSQRCHRQSICGIKIEKYSADLSAVISGAFWV